MRKTILLFPLLVILGGCKPHTDPTGLLPSADRAPHFDQTAEFLELGGVFYGFVDMTDMIARLGTSLTDLAASIKETTPEAPPLPLNFERFLSASGLAGLQAIGMSSREIEEGFFHNRTIFLFPEGVSGLFTMFGKSSNEFEGPRIAPSGTDLVVEMGLNAPAVRDSLLGMAAAVAGPFGTGALSSQLAMGLPQFGGRSPNQLIEALGTHFVAILQLDDSGKTLQLGPGLEIPSFEMAILIEGMTEILGSLRPALERQPEIVWTDTDTGFEISTDQALPPPFDDLRPLIVADTSRDRIFIVSTRAFLDLILSNGDKLIDSEEYAAAVSTLPVEGISLSYASADLFEPLRKVFVTVLAMEPDALPAGFAQSLIDWSLPEAPNGIGSVLSVREDGLYAASNTVSSHRSTVVSFAIQPVALMAAMAIPAFNQVRVNSQRTAVLNNLRQIAVAGQMYQLDNGISEVRYDQLVGDYIDPFVPVAGEDYSGLVVSSSGGTLKVFLNNGEIVEYTY